MQPIVPLAISLLAHIGNPANTNSLESIPTIPTGMPTPTFVLPNFAVPQTNPVLTMTPTTMVSVGPDSSILENYVVKVTLTRATSTSTFSTVTTTTTSTSAVHSLITLANSTFELYSPTNTQPIDPKSTTKELCEQYHVIVARGSDEAYDSPGAMSGLQNLIDQRYLSQKGLDSMSGKPPKKNKKDGLAVFHPVIYPATSDPYDVSVQEGAAEVTRLLNLFTMNSTCPKDTRIVVLMGFGQGAQIIQDAMCGGGATRSQTPEEQRLVGAYIEAADETEVLDRVAAVVQYSDPRRRWDSSIKHIGDAQNNGILPRKIDLESCRPRQLAKFISFCDAGDPLCDSGSNATVNAEWYSKKYDDQAYDFIKEKLVGHKIDLKKWCLDLDADKQAGFPGHSKECRVIT